MAEEKMQAAKVLLKNPYRQVILQDKTLESHKFRKKAEEIENELSWFTGKSSQYRVEDRQGFFKHFQEHYAGKKHGIYLQGLSKSDRFRNLSDLLQSQP